MFDPHDLIAALAAARVDYVVTGGYAVGAHGFPRATKRASGDTAYPHLRAGAVASTLGGHEIRVCSREDLVTMKLGLPPTADAGSSAPPEPACTHGPRAA